MTFMSKLKGGEKKATEPAKKNGKDDKQPAQVQQEKRPTVSRAWTAENMQQVNRTTAPAMKRTSSDFSIRSPRPRLPRASSGLSQEWTPSHQHSTSSSSIKSGSRNTSFQGLARVMEDGSDDKGIPPMPMLPVKYAAASTSSSSSKPRSSRSLYGSSIGKSPLSSAESSPVDSEDSSNASTKSEDILEIRSHPFSHPEQYVFHKDHDGETIRKDPKDKGKGKAPMFPVDVNPMDLDLDLDDEEDKRDSKIVENPRVKSPPERHYFTRSTPLGAPVSEFDNRRHSTATTISDATPKSSVAASKPAKKNRFSFLKRSNSGITAH